MIIGFDGLIYSVQAFGGINRLFNEILPRICEADPSLLFKFYAAPPYKAELPYHRQIRQVELTRRDLRPARLWQQVRPFLDRGIISATTAHNALWHSAYFTLPPSAARAVVVSFYDTAYHRYRDQFNLPGEETLRHRQEQLLGIADIVICISESTASDLRDTFGIAASKIRVIPLACSTIFRRLPDLASSSTKPYILFVGRRSKYKNFDGLVATYSRWSRRDEIDLVVAGSAWSRDEQIRLAELGIMESIRLIPNASDDVLVELYNRAAAFVCPSLHEGFGIPLLEAMACGCPIVVSNIPAFHEVGGDSATFFEPDDQTSLIGAIDRTLSAGRDTPLIDSGLERVKSFSWDRTALQTLGVYRSLS